ncbi:MAG: hypothetical protein EPN48_07855 [Microbacteriaceae bacterium]|nr:MAG: hypothetical protein EPN48_07855 [Microbacteriaceae bacterium]
MSLDIDKDVQVPLSEQSADVLQQLLAIWDEVSESEVPVLEDGDWERGVSARVQIEHAVGLTRAVLVLAKAGLRIESVPLVRMTMECAVTAVWLTIASGSGKASYYKATVDFKNLHLALLKIGNPEVVDDPDSKKLEADIGSLEVFRQKEARNFLDRCASVDSGEWLYAYYRLLSRTSHGGANLNDEYLQEIEHSESAPLGLAFKDPRDFALWPVVLGFQVTMLFNALQAWDRISHTRPRKSALDAISDQHDITLFDHLPA